MAYRSEELRQISPQEFAQLGLGDVAYTKSKIISGQTMFAIYTADGVEATVVDSEDLAIRTIVENDLEPVWIH